MRSSAILLVAFGLVAPSLACFGGGAGSACCPPSTPSCAPSIPRCSSASYAVPPPAAPCGASGCGAGGHYADSYPRPLGYQAPALPVNNYPQAAAPQGYVAPGPVNPGYNAAPPLPPLPQLPSAPIQVHPIVQVNPPQAYVEPAPVEVAPQVDAAPVPDNVPAPIVETETHEVQPEQPPPAPPVAPATENHVETNVAPAESTYDDVEDHAETTKVEEHHEETHVAEKPAEETQQQQQNGADYSEETNAESPAAPGESSCDDEELRAIVTASLESQMDNLEAARKIESESSTKFGGRFNSIVSDNEFAYVNWYGKRNCQLRVNNRHSLTWED